MTFLRTPDTPGLDASYERCRRVHRRHDPTYYLATRRLPAEVQPAVHALYAFVRSVDQLVDGPRRAADPAARLAAVDGRECELREARAGGLAPDAAIAALVDAGARHGLPLDELELYFVSMRLDCAPVRIQTWRERERYMQGSVG
ncbi:MAG TPA: squalene/phytoene synthase family protein, partial [Thermoleophilaceae bacterium]